MAEIQSHAYLYGLQTGFLAGAAFPRLIKKAYLRKLRSVTAASTAGWNARSIAWGEQMRAQRVQSNYVIELAAAARKQKVIIDVGGGKLAPVPLEAGYM